MRGPKLNADFVEGRELGNIEGNEKGYERGKQAEREKVLSVIWKQSENPEHADYTRNTLADIHDAIKNGEHWEEWK